MKATTPALRLVIQFFFESRIDLYAVNVDFGDDGGSVEVVDGGERVGKEWVGSTELWERGVVGFGGEVGLGVGWGWMGMDVRVVDVGGFLVGVSGRYY